MQKTEATLLEVTTRNFLIIRHKGIAIDTPEGKLVYHMDNEQRNECGGGLLKQPIKEFLEGRKLLGGIRVALQKNKLEEYYKNHCADKYSLINNNCEHFATNILYGKSYSTQLQAAVTFSLFSGVLAWLAIRKKKND